MPRIITNESIKDNIYRNILEPLVAAYNTTQNIKPNPHEVFLAAMYLEARTQYWGGNIPSASDSRRGDPECCLEHVVQMCCKNGIVAGAQADGPGAASPVTTRTETLRKELDNLVMNQPNAYVDWIYALGYFYESVGPFLSYFTYNYKDGRYADFYENTLNVFRHPDGYKTGIEFETVQEGIAAPATAGLTSVEFVTTNLGQEESYFLIYKDATNVDQCWFDAGSGIAPALAVVPGYTVTQRVFLADPALPPSDFANTVAGAFVGIPGYTSVTKTGASTVEFLTTYTGARPASDFSNMPVGEWVGTFVDGTDAGVSQVAEDCWQVWCAPSEVMADRFTIISDTLGATWLLYYDLDGGGVPPAGVVADNIVPIPVTTGMSAEEVTVATAAVLDGTGFVTTAITTNGYGTLTQLMITYILPGPVNEIDEGNAGIGINYAYYDELKGSDGTVLASGITNDAEYADAWNTFKVDFEETKGLTYPYLDSRLTVVGSFTNAASGTGASPCGVCFRSIGNAVWSGSGGTITGTVSCRGCTSAQHSGMFRAMTYNGTTNVNYNTPGNIFLANDGGRQASLTPVNELV